MTSDASPLPLNLVKGTASFPVDAEAQRFLDIVGQAPRSLADFRTRLTAMQVPAANQGQVDNVLCQPPADGAARNPFRLFRALTDKTLPLLLYFHCGGWSPGEPHSHDRWLRLLASETGMAVASLDDALPEDQGLQARVEGAESLIRWMKQNSGDLRIDPSQIALAGDSMGAHFAALTGIELTRKRVLEPFAMVLVCPLIIGARETASRVQFASGPWLTMDVVTSMLAHPTLDTRATSAALSSLLSARHLEGAPPTTVITAEYDCLRDEGEDYARVLMKAGVSVSATRYLGAIHNFPVLDQLADCAVSRAALQQVATCLRQSMAAGEGY